MDSPRLSVITPTIGAPTLQRVVDWFAENLHSGDEHLLVFDGPGWPDIPRYSRYDGRETFRTLVTPEHVGDGGYSPREYAMTRCRGTHIWFMDDDDMPARGAVETIRAAIEEEPQVPWLFIMDGPMSPVGKYGELARNSVSPQMFVVPNHPEKFHPWVNGHGYESDAEMILKTCHNFGGYRHKPVVVAHWRPGVPEPDAFKRRWSGS